MPVLLARKELPTVLKFDSTVSNQKLNFVEELEI